MNSSRTSTGSVAAAESALAVSEQAAMGRYGAPLSKWWMVQFTTWPPFSCTALMIQPPKRQSKGLLLRRLAGRMASPLALLPWYIYYVLLLNMVLLSAALVHHPYPLPLWLHVTLLCVLPLSLHRHL